MAIKQLFVNIYRFYADGFRNRLGATSHGSSLCSKRYSCS